MNDEENLIMYDMEFDTYKWNGNIEGKANDRRRIWRESYEDSGQKSIFLFMNFLFFL